jgi:SAM-dependent methyltransferase
MPISMNVPVTSANFSESAYLAANPDVARAVKDRRIGSGVEHFNRHGLHEKRTVRIAASQLNSMRELKMERLAPLIRRDLRHTTRNGKLDYLTRALRALAAVTETEQVSANGYDGHGMALVRSGGLILDCGAGQRDIYFENVVNFEIVDYDTTDVLGVGEELPFRDGSFDGVISVAVLEHVRDPFRCAREIVRVLKPGGKLYCAVPFLQPLHGYPNHYFNMTHEGLRALFDGPMEITGQDVLASTGPVWSLTWILRRWAEQLPPLERAAFLKQTVADLVGPPQHLLAQPWVTGLPKPAQFELASATVLLAPKR